MHLFEYMLAWQEKFLSNMFANRPIIYCIQNKVPNRGTTTGEHFCHRELCCEFNMKLLWQGSPRVVIWISETSLYWRHDKRNGVSNLQPHDCLLNLYSSADQRKHQSSLSLAFGREIHRWPVTSPHKGPVTRKMLPFDDFIMLQKNSWNNGGSTPEGL